MLNGFQERGCRELHLSTSHLTGATCTFKYINGSALVYSVRNFHRDRRPFEAIGEREVTVWRNGQERWVLLKSGAQLPE